MCEEPASLPIGQRRVLQDPSRRPYFEGDARRPSSPSATYQQETPRPSSKQFSPMFLDHCSLVPSQPVLTGSIHIVDHLCERTLSGLFQDVEGLLLVVAESHQKDKLLPRALR